MPWQIVHVPESTPSSRDLPTVDVLASTIEPKSANTLVRQLNLICPLENLRHVKRVRKRLVEGKGKLSVILCLYPEHENTIGEIPSDVLQIINSYQLNSFRTKVAKFAASSKEEWEEQCKLWPTSYHPATNVQGVTGFNEEELEQIIKYMKLAINLASTLDNKAVNAAVIVDPSNKLIIASANDQTFSTPKNATFPICNNCCQKSVATSDKIAEISASNLLTNDISLVSCLYPWRWSESRPNGENSQVKCEGLFSWHPLRHAVLVAIEYASERDKQLFPCLEPQKDHSISNICLSEYSNHIPAKRQKTLPSQNADISVKDGYHEDSPFESVRPYLCTGFDIYIVWEPCSMCAMALVHQRIRRIFYAFPNPNTGALGSVHRLHGEKSLNHHYSVFRILIPEEDCLKEDTIDQSR
ncbi:hypothetical protein AXF42_Ash008979 [Apostasia shenzhenica]|uniref:CMP/dCMP-type deaminase domain-containing protein n=1 Tax=Apostasia shenzhenica TaxID=1088818 RepID=A0A2I0AT10_9ASPA|nr:hypothetical protein AXF42_Ash008979 [Apostasia shenzhenica]